MSKAKINAYFNSLQSSNKVEFRFHLMKEINKLENELKEFDKTYDSLVKGSTRIMANTKHFTDEEKEKIKQELKRRESEYKEKRSKYEDSLGVLYADLKEIQSSKNLKNPIHKELLYAKQRNAKLNDLELLPPHMLKYLPERNQKNLRNRQTKRQRGGKKKQRVSTRKQTRLN